MDLAQRCATFAEMRRRPPMPEPLAVELYERVERRIPRTGLLVYGLIRQAVRAGYAGLWATHDEIGELIGGSGRAVRQNLELLVQLELVLQVALSVEREDSEGRKRVANCYTLGSEGKAASPRRARWDDRPPRAQGSRRHRGDAGRNVEGEGKTPRTPPASPEKNSGGGAAKNAALLLSESGRAPGGAPLTPRRVDGRAVRAASTASPAASAATSSGGVDEVSPSGRRDRSGASGDAPCEAASGGGSGTRQSTIRTTAAGPGALGTLGDRARCSPEAAALLQGRGNAGGPPPAAAAAPSRPVARSASEARAAAAAALHDGADLERSLHDVDPEIAAAAPWGRDVVGAWAGGRR